MSCAIRETWPRSVCARRRTCANVWTSTRYVECHSIISRRTADPAGQKKYEKAKERFKQQKVKHEEQMRKMQKEYMEREKLHWRQQQQLQEEAEWERHLRTDANDLIAYLEIEHLVAMQFQKDRRLELQQSLRQQQAEHTSLQESAQHTPVEAPQQRDEPVDMDMDIAIDDSPEEPQANHAEPNAPRNSTTPARTSHTPIPTDSPQSTVAIAHTAPKPTLTQSQTLTVPINFNDDDDSSDKENNPQHQPRTPLPARHVSAPPHHLKTPMTVSSSTPALHPNIPHFLNTPIDREAALAAIRERRGRARSNGAATMTPRRLGRDASAPPIGGLSASVGRASARS